MAVARVDAALPPGDGKAIPTRESEGLLHGTELNSCLMERSLGLGVQFWTSSFDAGLWVVRGRAALWEL